MSQQRGRVVLQAVVVGVVMAAAVAATAASDNMWTEPSKDTLSGYNRRMTTEERKEVFRELKMMASEPCVPPTTPPENPKPLPKVPRSFITQVEVTNQKESQMSVIYGSENFDGVLNKGVVQYELNEGVTSNPYLKEQIIHYSVPDDIALFIITDIACEDLGDENCQPKKQCHASDLEGLSEAMNELFGFGDANGQEGFYGAGGILQWGDQYNYEYKQNKVCRGMRCDWYQACVTNPEEEATLLLNYYWSRPEWEIISNKDQIPVAVEVVASGKFGHLFTRKVVLRYDFYEFHSNIRPSKDLLEPPADVYCKDRVSSVSPPVVPYYFSYNSEVVTQMTLPVDTGNNQTEDVTFDIVTNHFEFYDWREKVVMSQYVPWLLTEESRYEYEATRIQDFKQGLKYLIRKHKNTCHVSLINNSTFAGDIIIVENGTVSLLPPWDFQDMDGPFQYNGVHWTRGMEADVWIGRTTYAWVLHQNHIWYYASPLVYDPPIRKGDTKRSEGQWRGREEERDLPQHSLDKVPLRMERYVDLKHPLVKHVYNLYDYQINPPLTHTIDISLCFKDSQALHYVLDLPPGTLEEVLGLRDSLLYSAQRALAETAIISPLRINKPVLEVGEDFERILFTILDQPEVVGDAPDSEEQSDLDTAADLIISAVDGKQFVIVVHLEEFVLTPEEPVYKYIIPTGIRKAERDQRSGTYTYTTSKGYESGDMAGIAVGMLVAGALVAVVVSMLLQRRSGGSGGLPRVNMARKVPMQQESTINIDANITGSDI